MLFRSMAQLGGIGVLHRNLETDQQCAAVRAVKRFESGMVVNPITIQPDAILGEAQALMEQNRISGIPVTDPGGTLVGILTNRDMRFIENEATPVHAMMTSEGLAVAREPVEPEEARRIMHQRRIEKLLVTDGDGKLTGLLTLKDTEQAVLNPTACKDSLGRLRVAAASTVGDAGFERAEALVDAGVDMIVADGQWQGAAATVLEVNAAPGLNNLYRQGPYEANCVKSIYAALFQALFEK